jgi:hypothetical protein
MTEKAMTSIKYGSKKGCQYVILLIQSDYIFSYVLNNGNNNNNNSIAGMQKSWTPKGRVDRPDAPTGFRNKKLSLILHSL